ncbi:hypothetical protein TW84_02200 [Vibrio neptunius]|uniref:hypothetical protein n=1 Tax=Vibrio neptunius TaxID=170651 RepID=UPI0005F9DA07|nr:hypothetical protein [Vibrio neptunius]KJY93876.1 hypothetical protein TW84_02200 [Vibrio neptunius]
MRFTINLVLIVATAFISNAFAWDGTVNGRVTKVEIAPASELKYRIFLDGGVKICDTSSDKASFAYINPTDPTYQAVVSLSMLARTSNNKATIYTTRDANGYCKIGDIQY